MALRSCIREATMDYLRKIDISSLDIYDEQDRGLLVFLHNQGVIDNNLIEEALKEAVFKQAGKEYDLIIRYGGTGTPLLNYVQRSDCLAYALKHGIFSKREMKKIPFDQGETVDTFIQCYEDCGLLKKLRKEILTPKQIALVSMGTNLPIVRECGPK